MALWTLVLLLFLSSCSATPCEECCAPGGTCAKAFKQGPGKCCGQRDGRSFCCPSLGNPQQDAKCCASASGWSCNHSRCPVTPPWKSTRQDRYQPDRYQPDSNSYGYRSDAGSSDPFGGTSLFVPLLIGLCAWHFFCRRGPQVTQGEPRFMPVNQFEPSPPPYAENPPPSHNPDFDKTADPHSYPAQPYPTQPYSQPYAAQQHYPRYPAQQHYPVESQVAAQNQGYGGGAMMASGLGGMLGGMMLADMMHHPSMQHGHDAGFPAEYDSGFAADSFGDDSFACDF